MKHTFFIKKSFFVIVAIISLQSNLATIQQFDDRLMTEEELFELIAEAKKEDAKIDIMNLNDLTETRNISPKKPMTLMIFIAGDNDLHYFAWKNIKQMEMIGSNENINIVVQLNTPGYLNPTKRYLIKKGKRLLVYDPSNPNQKLNSGSPYTLIDFVDWAVKTYPAEDYALILWNHGTGAIDPGYVKTFNPCELFYCNPENKLLEIDRGSGYLNLIIQYAKEAYSKLKRGMCFDETFKSYISNQDFEFALHEIFTKILKGKKLGVLGFDACLMSMIEIASIAKKYAQYMVASQEVELGTGWNYEFVLQPFTEQILSPRAFAEHIVLAYEKTYNQITNEYTESALDLNHCQKLEENINTLSNLLLETLAGPAHHQTLQILRKCKSTQYCTCFDEPSYKDIGHFYKNILQHLQYFNLQDKGKETMLQNNLKQTLTQGLQYLEQCVIKNKVGSKLKNAHGISIYFPEHTMSQSYLKSSFAINNNWVMLLAKYLLG